VDAVTVLCFIEPADAIRVIADSIGQPARRKLVRAVVRAWVDEIPEAELPVHYAKAVAALGDEDLHTLAGWHATNGIARPLASAEFLVGLFPSLGASRREALALAAAFHGEQAFDAGVTEERALAVVLPHLSRERAAALAHRCVDLYVRDRLGNRN
jgi:hypothetical protein